LKLSSYNRIEIQNVYRKKDQKAGINNVQFMVYTVYFKISDKNVELHIACLQNCIETIEEKQFLTYVFYVYNINNLKQHS